MSSALVKIKSLSAYILNHQHRKRMNGSTNQTKKNIKQGELPKDDKSPPELLQIPKQLQHSSQELLQNKQQLILNLKKLHMKQQTELVKEITVMAKQSKKIIDDITVIQGDIDTYQTHIDQWIKKIQDLRVTVEKVKKVRQPFRLKATNMSKIKDYLSKEIKKHR